MLMRAIIGRLKCCKNVSSQFIQSLPKKNSFSNIKNLKIEEHVSLRTYVSAVPELNKSSTPEQDDENREQGSGFYYRKYVLTDPQFTELVFREELISENACSSSLLLATLKELNGKTEVVTEDLKCLLPHLEEELHSLNFYELLEAMNLIFKMYHEKDDVWEVIRNCFDKELVNRKKSLSINELFIVCNVLLNLRIFKDFNFTHKIMNSLSFKVNKLTHAQFVHFCYYLRTMKYIALDKFKFEFMVFINERIPSLNQTELGVLADAFNCTQLKLNHPLFQNVMTKVLKDIENIDAPVLISICRNVARVRHVGDVQLLIDFQEKLIPLVSKFHYNQIRNLLYSGISVRYLNKTLYDEVMKRVKSEMANIYLTEISGLAFLHTTFNIDDREFIDMAVNEFERRDDCHTQWVAYVKFLSNLIHLQIYPKDLLEKALSNDVLMKIMKYKSGTRAWASLKWSLEIEKPELQFSKVDENMYKKLLKYMKYKRKVENELEFYYHSKLNSILKELYGKNLVSSKRISFHSPNCCIMRFDKNLKPQEIPKEFKESTADFKIRAPCDGHIWVCIIPLYRDYYTDFVEKVINYRTATLLRHMSILGYKHIFITPMEWHSSKNQQPSNLAFLESLINNKLNELIGEVQQSESEK